MRYIVFVLLGSITVPVLAWDGTDQYGNSVEIEKGNLVRAGSDIEVYDHSTGQYRDVTVESVRSYGSGAEVEVYDSNSGEYQTLDMD